MSEIHKNAFWAYGVILALAIREPLSHVIPHFITDGIFNWQVQLELWRLVLFLILIVRFYLGAGMYFDEVFCNPGTRIKYVKKSYPFDFLSGLIHFIVFFSAAVCLSLHGRISEEISYFMAAIAVVLLYDNVWWAGTWLSKFDSLTQIRDWSNYNNKIFVVTLVIYVGCRVAKRDQVLSEHIAIFPILLFSLYDVKQIINVYEIRERTA